MKTENENIVRSFPEKRIVNGHQNSEASISDNAHSVAKSSVTYSHRIPSTSMLITSHITVRPLVQSRFLYASLVALLLLTSQIVTLANKDRTRRGAEGSICGSPRFLVKSGDSNAFALKSTNVTANIIGVIADVHVRQVYFNEGEHAAEATYIFPASTRAAVYGMTMSIRDRVINAVIQEKQQARQTYRAAVASGRAATLLEQIRPNIFQMSVGNILPHDSIIVDMHYTEAIDYSNGVYEFVYPAVVGPRYVSASTPKEYDEILSSRDIPQEVPGTFHIQTTISAGMPLKSVLSPSHTLDMQTLDARTLQPATEGEKLTSTRVEPKAQQNEGNRDFVLNYRLSGRAIESGLLLSKGQDENYFMLMVQPPRNVDIPHILPREYVFIVDVSGSMEGQPLTIAKQLMSDLLDKLRPEDKFNILMFSGGSQFMAENSLFITKETRERAKNFLNSGYGGGGTEILPALKHALSMKEEPGMSRNFVIVTDGYVQCEREAFTLVRQSLNHANIYAFGIGGSVNRFLMEGLARAGNADPMIVLNMSEAPKMAERFREYIEAPVLTNIKVNYGGLNVFDVDPISIPDVTSKRPIIVYGKWKGDATGTLHVTGSATTGAYDFSVNLSAAAQRPEYSALRYLWARNRIRMIQDGSINSYGSLSALSVDEAKTITSIGLKYNLLTDYTSFVAVDSVISVTSRTATVKTPSPSEQGTFSNGVPESGDVHALGTTVLSPQTTISTNTTKFSTTAQGTASANSSGASASAKVFKQVAPSPTTGVVSNGGGISIRGGRSSDTKVRMDVTETSDNIGSGTFAIPESAQKNKDSKTDDQRGRAGTSNTSNATSPNQRNVALGNSTDSLTSRAPTLLNNSSDNADVARAPRAVIIDNRVTPSTQNSAPTRSNSSQVVVTQSNSGYYLDESSEVNALMPGKAPPHLYTGPVIAFNYSTQSTADYSLIDPALNSIIIPSGTATGGGFTLGWTVEYFLGDPRFSSQSVISELTYSTLPTSFEADAPARAYKSSNFDSTTVPAHFILKNRTTLMHLGFFYKFNIGKTPLGLLVGPSVDYVIKATADHTAQLQNSSEALLWYRPTDSTILPTDNNGSRVILHNGDIADINRLRVGITAGVQYEILLRKMSLVPQIVYDFGLTKNISGTRVSALKVGCALSFAL